MRRVLFSLLLCVLASAAIAAKPVTFFRGPGEQVTLWMEGAPRLSVSAAEGWQPLNPGDEWTARVLKVNGLGPDDMWPKLLKGLFDGEKFEGFAAAPVVGRLVLRTDPTRTGVRLSAVRPPEVAGTADFSADDRGGLVTKDARALEQALARLTKAQPSELAAALIGRPWASNAAPRLDGALWAKHAADLNDLAGPRPLLVVAGTTPGIVLEQKIPEADYVSTVWNAATAPKQADTHSGEPEKSQEKPSSSFPIVLIVGTAVVAGAAGFFANGSARQALMGKLSRSSTETHRVPMPVASPASFDHLTKLGRDLSELHRDAVALKGNMVPIDPLAWVKSLRNQTDTLAKSTADQAQTIEALNTEIATLDTSFAAYRKEHSEFPVEKRRLQSMAADASAALSKEREALAALNRTLESERNANKKDQESLRVQAARIAELEEMLRVIEGRQKAYAEIQRLTLQLHNQLHGELNRPEISGIVGYLLNFSAANLLSTLEKPNPPLERAMLANLRMIAEKMPSGPKSKRLLELIAPQEARLDGAGVSTRETASLHPDGRQVLECLNLVRDWKQIYLTPFHVGVDDAGNAYTVHVAA